ncbi:hypothetical protein MCOR25_010165 [Pyricularia grisea]|uniref:NmrA-like domain-containing protein n=1 Tax=Pyricularia grisea TaxID=148305 RepID=A0A6P8ANP6_PYRGI|nr:uncharacterized protein PgNI_11814 [Pyricularia grisea]KAI6351071.1 hypothetical protein MCOR25_010165 [Pyricularia grisea]TLD03654.1 hypothetical protein PgNI_11814 [Pyricularia grisea]
MSTFLVIQATGGQGQWVITHLLKSGAKVHALVRDVNKPLPAILKAEGVTLFEGESVNAEAVYAAAKGTSGVFLNTFMSETEIKQAESVVEGARRAGVETIVASTAIGSGDKTILESEYTKSIGLHQYYVNKNGIQEVVKNGGFKSWTILHPAYIHFDIFTPKNAYNFPRMPQGILDHVLDAGRKIAHTDASDIGRYAAAALMNPEKFNGEIVELGLAMDCDEMAADLSKVSGKNVEAVRYTFQEAQKAGVFQFGMAFQLLANVFDFSNLVGAGLRNQEKYGIHLLRLEESLVRDKEQLMSTLIEVN